MIFDPVQVEDFLTPLRRRLVVAAVLLLAGAFALHSLRQDSLTYDELAHLTAGMSHWKTGDYRLQPEHPPLAKMWAALPLLAMDHAWPPLTTSGWLEGEVWPVGRTWLYQLNDGERLLLPARLMMLPIYLCTCLAVYLLSRRIFGTTAGVISLLLAASCPNLAAHGRLVTNDVTLTLCTTLTLLAYARLAERFTWGRLSAAAAMLSITALAKSSWMLVLPALLIMAGLAIAQGEKIDVSTELLPKTNGVFGNRRRVVSRVLPTLIAAGASIAVTWIVIWAAYGFRFSPFRGADAIHAVMTRIGDPGKPSPMNMAEAWETILHDSEGRPRQGAKAGFIRFARRGHLLPEAMLYGLAHNLKFSESPPGYLMGEVYHDGRAAYFPVAFAIKTPLGTQLLFLVGMAAVVLGKASVREPIALAGLLTYAVVVLSVAMASNFNIGLRHILPVYPAVFVLGGAAVTWAATVRGRRLVLLLLVWVAAARLCIHPHYLSYFNELIGGPGNGHKYLADSNIDWGQDLKRLSRYARAHPEETIKLAYFGSADPTRYGIKQMLPSSFPFGESAPLKAGTYVASVNQLLAVLVPTATDTYWADPQHTKEYAELARFLSADIPTDASDSVRQQRRAALLRFLGLRYSKLLHQLRHRQPDERIGYTLFLYRLSDQQVEELLRPGLP